LKGQFRNEEKIKDEGKTTSKAKPTR